MSTTQALGFGSVILDSAIDKALDYAIPPHYGALAKPGMRVLVPVRGALRKGTLIALKEQAEVANAQPIAELLGEEPLVSEELFQLAGWIARYYCAPLRKVLKAILPPSVRKETKEKRQLLIKSALSRNELAALCEELRRTQGSQAAVLDALLQAPKGLLLTELLEIAEVSRSPVDTLIKKKVLLSEPVLIDRSPVIDEEYFKTKAKSLTDEQSAALGKIQECLEARRFETHLIHGVTGSGKTEIYLQAIEKALALKMGAILLVPEISLTSQTIERLRSRFAERIAILHHRLSQGERHTAWHAIRKGEASIVIGARSALFSPVLNLGLIIVDEEHESSYKQSDEAPCYHARDVAVMRGKLCNATVILGSATPSLESYHNALSGKYHLSKLTQRADSASLPTATIIDMKIECAKAKRITLFSEALLSGIEKRLKTGEQTLLFLNRRGYHTSQRCLQCAHVMQCPHCEVTLTFHLNDNLLACHLCDYRLAPPRLCPKCKSEGAMKYKGAGTEQVERALHAIFPEVRTLRLDADTTRHKGSHDLLLKQFRSGKADVLIGTQMISKGLHFPSVTLVGILNADTSLQIPDFRASEQTFQLITQVAGRAGRAFLAGEVLIQTHLPDHPIIHLAKAQDYESFYAQEVEARKLFDYPPFSHLVKVTFAGPSSQRTQQTAHEWRGQLIERLPPAYQIHPVIACGHAKIKDNFRFQFLIKGEKTAPVTRTLEEMKKNFNLSREIRLSIDVDPLSTFF